MKYAVKVTKRDQAGPLIYPLNYLLHERLIPLYLEDSLLATNFQDLFSTLEGFSYTFIGVKPAFQLLHLIKHVFNSFILKGGESQTFAELDEAQNRAL